MKLYVVTANDYLESYGAEIKLLGVFSDRGKAEKRKRDFFQELLDEAEDKGLINNMHPTINTAELDSRITINCVECDKEVIKYLGGYIE